MLADLNKKYITTRPSKALVKLVGYFFFSGRPITTKGQWINPYLFKLFKLLSKFPQQKRVIKPIFIIGMGRSGTTILGNILSIHKQIGFLNEPKALWHYIYSKQDIIGSHSTGEAYYYLDKYNVDTNVKRRANRIYGSFLRITFTERILDKYPELIFRIPFIRTIFPDAKFLLIIRNGWDVIHSVTKWSIDFNKEQDENKHDWWGINDRKWDFIVNQLVPKTPILKDKIQDIQKFKKNTDRAATEWIVTMQQVLKIKQTKDESIFYIKFEDLTTNPRENLIEILKFCHLKNDQKFIEYACSTLKKINRKTTIELHPSIKNIFNATMEELAYS